MFRLILPELNMIHLDELFLGDALQDDDTIKIVNYVNERDLTFLKDRVSATDRMLYQARI